MVKSNIKMGKLSVPLDVRSGEHIPAFEDILSKGPMAIVLVYADWCGHCDTFKKNVWNPMKSTKNRTMNMASVHYDQLENTSLNGTKINGYPSVLMVGTDKKPASFNTDEGETNAMPNTSDLKTMKRLVTTPVTSMKSENKNMNSLNYSPSLNMGENMDENVGENVNENLGENVNENVGENVNENLGENVNENVEQTMAANNNLNAQNITPPNVSEDVNLYETNIGKNTSKNSNANSAAINTARNIPKNSNGNSGIAINTATNIPKRTQGTTPILQGGRLYRNLTSKKRKSHNSRKSRKSRKSKRNSKK